MNTLNSTPKNRENEAPIPDSIPMSRENKTLPMYVKFIVHILLSILRKTKNENELQQEVKNL